MPMSKEGKKMMNSMEKTYGEKKAKEVFNKMENQDRVPGMAMGGMAKKTMGYGEGGLVKATGKMNTGIKSCGDA